MKPKRLLLLCYLILTFVIIAGKLRAQDKPEIVITRGHTTTINCIAWHPSKKIIATGGGTDMKVKIWDVKLKKEFRTLAHSSQVRDIQFTSSGKYLIVNEASMGIIRIWEPLSGNLIHTFNKAEHYSPFKLSPDGKTIALQYDQPTKHIRLIDIESGENLDSIAGEEIETFTFLDNSYCTFDSHKNDFPFYLHPLIKKNEVKPIQLPLARITSDKFSYNNLTTDNKGLFLAYEGFNDNRQTALYIYHVAAKKHLFNTPIILDDHDLINQVQVNSTSNTIIILSAYHIYIFDLYTGKRLQKIGEQKNTTYNTYAIDYEGQILAYSSTNEMKIISIKTGKIMTTFCKNESLGTFAGMSNLSLSSNQKYLMSQTVGSLKFWNIKEGDQFYATPLGSSFSSSSEDGTYLATSFLDTLVVYNLQSLSPVFKTYRKLSMNTSLSGDGNTVACINLNTNSIGVWKVDQAKKIAELAINKYYNIIKLSHDGSFLFLYTLNSMDKINAIHIASGKITELVYPSRSILKYFHTGGANSTHVFLSLINVVEGNKIIEINYETGAIVKEIITPYAISCIANSPNNEYLANAHAVNMNMKGISDFNINISMAQNGEERSTLIGHESTVLSMAWSNDNTTLYSYDEEGVIKIWDVLKATCKATLIANSDGSYLIYTEDGYYKSSKGNYEGICFRYKGSLYTFDQFDLLLNRPDKVMEALGGSPLLTSMYYQAYQKRIKRAGYTQEPSLDNLSLPELRIINPDKIPLTVSNPKLSFAITAQDLSASLDRILVYVNNVPVYGRAGMKITATSKDLEKNIDLVLSNGDNLVEVSVVNNLGLESPRESFRITCQTTIAPDLYILAVGVSKFQQEQYNLKYASKDALDLCSTMRSCTKFKNIHITTIADAEATKENISNAFNALNNSKTNDVVMIYFSTHGLIDDQYNYYMATHDVDFSAPSNRGFLYESIEDGIDKITARNRLLLIDACHSGEIDNEEVLLVKKDETTNTTKNEKSGTIVVKSKSALKNSFGYMKELFSEVAKNTGTTTITASQGTEVALESNEWNNGVFTYSIMQGLTQKGADVNYDQSISLTELKNFVVNNVRNLTKGSQTPSARQENELNNFIIY